MSGSYGMLRLWRWTTPAGLQHQNTQTPELRARDRRWFWGVMTWDIQGHDARTSTEYTDVGSPPPLAELGHVLGQRSSLSAGMACSTGELGALTFPLSGTC